ncbi:MAG: WHG domain-containing protein, partial [Alphaproteobacteria bacterium]
YEVMFRHGDLVEGDADLESARSASLRSLTRLTRSDGADQPPGEVTLISWAFAHGAASLAIQGVLEPKAVDELISSFAALALS